MIVTLRPRRPDDLPGLGVDLLEQQPRTCYPFRNPLPIPTDQFLHADDALGALVAERDGDVMGHVCWVGPTDVAPETERLNRACADAVGAAGDRTAWLSALS